MNGPVDLGELENLAVLVAGVDVERREAAGLRPESAAAFAVPIVAVPIHVAHAGLYRLHFRPLDVLPLFLDVAS